MALKVYHLTPFGHIPHFSEPLKLIDQARKVWTKEDTAGSYVHVATVSSSARELDALEYAFMGTNHIDGDWTERSMHGIIAEPGRHRSTSIGDVIETAEGDVYVVASFGFEIVVKAA